MTESGGERLRAAQQAEAVRSHRISPQVLAEQAIAVLQDWQPLTNVYSQLWIDEALERAKAALAESAESAQTTLPLQGVPVLVKESFDVSGHATTGCCRAFTDNIARSDALLVRRLTAAGALVIGKANQHELAASGTGHISTCGPTRNPWDPARLAGGSSGGSAIAVAIGAVPITLGTDTAGSIRTPSSFCGVVGLKPTQGRLPMTGVMPLAPSLGCPGPMGRTVEDVALAFRVLDRHRPPRPPEAGEIAGLRLGCVRTGFFAHDVHPHVRAALEGVTRVLVAAGMQEVEVTVPGVDEALHVWGDLAWPEFAEAFPDLDLSRVGHQIADHYAYGLSLPPSHRAAARARAEVFRRAFLTAFQKVDLLLLPATPYAAPRFDEDEVVVGHAETMNVYRGGPVWFTCPINIVGFPALSLPSGFDPTGLPLGVQLVARPDEEWTLLHAGIAFQARTEHHTRAPSLRAALDQC